MQLEFGLSAAVPETVSTAWGARLIFPADLLHDRQGFGGDPRGEEGRALVEWLNGGALPQALETARHLAKRYKLTRDGKQTVVLYSDPRGVVVASPQSSCGYLYVAAWLHNNDAKAQPAAEFVTVDARDPWEK